MLKKHLSLSIKAEKTPALGKKPQILIKLWLRQKKSVITKDTPPDFENQVEFGKPSESYQEKRKYCSESDQVKDEDEGDLRLIANTDVKPVIY
jgi:hypothetical protein